MTKTDLVQRLIDEFAHLGAPGAKRAVDAVLGKLESGLAEGRRIELRDFGVFTRRSYPARPRRNPRTGEDLAPAGYTRTRFVAGKDLSERINRR